MIPEDTALTALSLILSLTPRYDSTHTSPNANCSSPCYEAMTIYGRNCRVPLHVGEAKYGYHDEIAMDLFRIPLSAVQAPIKKAK